MQMEQLLVLRQQRRDVVNSHLKKTFPIMTFLANKQHVKNLKHKNGYYIIHEETSYVSGKQEYRIQLYYWFKARKTSLS